MAMIVLLELNNIIIEFTNEDLTDLGFGVADGRYDEKYIENWIAKFEK